MVEDLRTGGDLRLCACVFRRCVLRGRIGSIIAYEAADFLEPLGNPVNRAFYEDNSRMYSETEWALDISEAEFDSLDLRAVPAELVRINDRSQARVDFEAAAAALVAGTLAGAPEYPLRLLEAAIEQRRETRRNLVLVTNPRDPEFQGMLTLFELLRSHGVTLR